MRDREYWNKTRYAGGASGHYESFFQRANHPSKPRAFWIRYTLFSPKGRPDDALGELWAVYFDRDEQRIVAVRETRPLRESDFSTQTFRVHIGEAKLGPDALIGQASLGEHQVCWDLGYTSPAPPLLFLDESLYDRRLPKAKTLVGSPMASYRGALTVDGESVPVNDWIGSQNHNWGEKHTDAYAWGQVAGFDNAPDAFFECSTARIKIGPLWTPWLTLMVLRVGDDTYALNGLWQALRASGRYEHFDWRFDSRREGIRIHGQFEAPASAFVGLTYLNPPGGAKTCLNSKVARCRVTLERAGQEPRTLSTESRAAFEILTDDDRHGIPIAV